MKTLTKSIFTMLTLATLVCTACDPAVLKDIPDPIENPDGKGKGNGNENGLHAGIPVINGLSFLTEAECGNGIKKVYRNASTDWDKTIDNIETALHEAGFTNIGTTRGGGDLVSGYGGRQVWGYKGSRYVKINAQVQQSGSKVYICAWPQKPSNDNCSNNTTDNDGNGGSDENGGKDENGSTGTNLHEGVPVISGLTFVRETTCGKGIKKIYRNSSQDYQRTIDNYIVALNEAGLTSVNSSQGGGWNGYGGRQAWGYKGSRYVKVNAQVQSDSGSLVYICGWPNKPQDDDCDDD